ncbi:MAG: peptidoglycan/xylan/chitin deacetylase (PgdA/CDA1 family) [Verrucomicrobiales bacterium]|jgi:peptidoglycan/xylan/chitin deacetylase (PgdA/CDA1 family)
MGGVSDFTVTLAMKVKRSSTLGWLLPVAWHRQCVMAGVIVCALGAFGCLEKKSEPAAVLPPPLVDPSDVQEVDPAASKIDPEIPELTINKEAQVSILGYHDFITGKSTNPMMINIDKFRQQMQALKDADISVIGFDDFFAWRRGEKNINDPSVIITVDDGWRSTYELAWPVLKEFNYPFSIYLYKNYVGGGGRALTVPMIKEMIEGGVEIGSHTVSHPLRKSVFAYPGRRTQEEFDEYLRVELLESKQFLEGKFGIAARTFAYPGGIHTDEIVALCERYGYEASITCNPSRTTWDTPLQKLNRYIVHGNNDLNFGTALSFRKFSATNSRVIVPTGEGMSDSADPAAEAEEGAALRVTVTPAPNTIVSSRTPAIEVNLSQVEGEILPESIQLKMSGYGQCPSEYDAEKRVVRYTPSMAIRRKITEVAVNFKRQGESKEDIVGWQFEIDLSAAYFPAEDKTSAAPPAPLPKEE